MKKRVLTNIPADRVERTKAGFEREGCSVVVETQANGLFTITATCPSSASTKQIVDEARAER